MNSSEIGQRLAVAFDLGQWIEWFSGLERGFIFLLALPLVVAIVGLWASYFHDDEDRK